MVILVRSLHKCGGAITVGVKEVLFMVLEGEVMRLRWVVISMEF